MHKFKVGDLVQTKYRKNQGTVKGIVTQGKQVRVIVDYGYKIKQNWIEQLEKV